MNKYLINIFAIIFAIILFLSVIFIRKKDHNYRKILNIPREIKRNHQK